MVDKRTLEKYEREAKEKNRETWYELTEDNIVLFSLRCDENGNLCVSPCPCSTGDSLCNRIFPFGSFLVLAVVEENRGSKGSGKAAAKDSLRVGQQWSTRGGH